MIRLPILLSWYPASSGLSKEMFFSDLVDLFFQKYVIPYLYGKEQEEYEKLEKNLAELNQGVNSLGK